MPRRSPPNSSATRSLPPPSPNNLVASAGPATFTVTNTPGGTSATPATDTFTIGNASPTPALVVDLAGERDRRPRRFHADSDGNQFHRGLRRRMGSDGAAKPIRQPDPTDGAGAHRYACRARPSRGQSSEWRGGRRFGRAITFTINANNLQPTRHGPVAAVRPGQRRGLHIDRHGRQLHRLLHRLLERGRFADDLCQRRHADGERTGERSRLGRASQRHRLQSRLDGSSSSPRSNSPTRCR